MVGQGFIKQQKRKKKRKEKKSMPHNEQAYLLAFHRIASTLYLFTALKEHTCLQFCLLDLSKPMTNLGLKRKLESLLCSPANKINLTIVNLLTMTNFINIISVRIKTTARDKFTFKLRFEFNGRFVTCWPRLRITTHVLDTRAEIRCIVMYGLNSFCSYG